MSESGLSGNALKRGTESTNLTIGVSLMMRGMGLLLGFQLVGELIVWVCRLPISGPICGMAALLAWLCCEGCVSDNLGKVADGLLANMAILFVPVGAGAIVYADLFKSHWPAVVIAVVLGTFATIAVTAIAARLLSRVSARTSRLQLRVLAQRLRASGRGAARIQRIAAQLAAVKAFRR